MTTLTTEVRDILRDGILQRTGLLRNEIDSRLRGTHGAGLPNRYLETRDEAVADLVESVEIGEIDRDVAELGELESALVRLDTAQYGVCADCGAAIPLARLRALPQAERCVPCEERFEKWRTRIPRS